MFGVKVMVTEEQRECQERALRIGEKEGDMAER
jgi:hypothetical protein